MIERWEVLAYTARRPSGHGYVLRLQDAEGRTGLGEARALEGFGSSPAALHDFVTDASAVRTLIDVLESDSSARTGTDGLPVEAVFAAETALADLEAQRRGVTLVEFLGFPAKKSLRNSLLVGDEREALDLLRAGHRNFKVKARGLDDACLHLLRCLHEASDGEVRIRVDANGSWTRESAQVFLDRAPAGSICFVEQPFPKGDTDSCVWLRAQHDIPIALDEGADSVAAVRTAARAGAAQLLVIKPMYRGLRGALDLATAAADLGLGACVTHAMDATIGRLAAMHVAAAVDALCGDAAWPHGLYAPGLTTLADEPVLEPDRLFLPPLPGLGCSGLRAEVLRQVSAGR